MIQGNQCWGNALDGINLGTINPSAATPPVYTLGNPSLTTVSVLDNLIWSNGSYGVQAYGDYLDVSGNQITQTCRRGGRDRGDGTLFAGRPQYAECTGRLYRDRHRRLL